MRKLCLSGFRLVVLFCCLVAPPFAVYDFLNQDERQQVATFIANLVFQQSVWYAKSATKIAREIHQIWRNKSLFTIQEISTWWSTFIEGYIDIIADVATPTTRERVLSKYSTMRKQWTSSYSRSESPLVAESTTAATASGIDIHDVTDWRYAYCIYCYRHWPNRFTTGRGRGKNQQEKNDLFLKTVTKSLWGLLCVPDNVVI